jgi:hypothetical protein
MANEDERRLEPQDIDMVNVTGDLEVFLDGKSARVPWANETQKYRFNANNGVLVAIGKDPFVYIARSTPRLVKLLSDTGYTFGGMYVPFSNDCGRKINRLFPRG